MSERNCIKINRNGWEIPNIWASFRDNCTVVHLYKFWWFDIEFLRNVGAGLNVVRGRSFFLYCIRTALVRTDARMAAGRVLFLVRLPRTLCPKTFGIPSVLRTVAVGLSRDSHCHSTSVTSALEVITRMRCIIGTSEASRFDSIRKWWADSQIFESAVPARCSS